MASSRAWMQSTACWRLAVSETFTLVVPAGWLIWRLYRLTSEFHRRSHSQQSRCRERLLRICDSDGFPSWSYSAFYAWPLFNLQLFDAKTGTPVYQLLVCRTRTNFSDRASGVTARPQLGNPLRAAGSWNKANSLSFKTFDVHSGTAAQCEPWSTVTSHVKFS